MPNPSKRALEIRQETVGTPQPETSLSENPFGDTRIHRLTWILSRLEEVPKDWLGSPAKAVPGSGTSYFGGEDGEIEPETCESFEELIGAWKEAMFWTPGLERGLVCMLATSLSTVQVGDQLWMKIIGPPSCGKSTLCEALSVAKRYVYPKSTIRGFHSGSVDESGQDYSLISKVNGMTLATKDGDTLLQAPNLGQILSEARDVYDTVSRTSFRNRASNDYSGIRMTWILCGTASLRSIDSSELGERFLDCVIMDEIDDELEDMILARVAERAEQNLSLEADGDLTTQYDPKMLVAMRKTGGYVEYLRQNSKRLLENTTIPPEHLYLCTRLGKFVSFMRARPSHKQRDKAEREFAARLVSQITRLMKCVSVVYGRPVVDEYAVEISLRVAMDTARGLTLDIADWIHAKGDALGEGGLTSEVLSIYTKRDESELIFLLKFLRDIKVVESRRPKNIAKGGKVIASKLVWSLTPRIRKLYEEISAAVPTE